MSNTEAVAILELLRRHFLGIYDSRFQMGNEKLRGAPFGTPDVRLCDSREISFHLDV
jgi:hypothetical protein